jgi:hypothetical protein
MANTPPKTLFQYQLQIFLIMYKLILVLFIVCLSSIGASAQQLTPFQTSELQKMQQKKISPAKINAKRSSYIKQNQALAEKKKREQKQQADRAAKKKADDVAAAKAKQKKGETLEPDEKKLLVDDHQQGTQIRTARSPQQQKAIKNKNSGSNEDAPVINGNQDPNGVNYGNGTRNLAGGNSGTSPSAAPNQLKTNSSGSKSSGATTASPDADVKTTSNQDKTEGSTGQDDSKANAKKEKVDAEAEKGPNDGDDPKAKTWEELHTDATPAERAWYKSTPEQKKTVHYTLDNPVLRRELTIWMTSEYSVENIKFLDALEYNKNKKYIYEMYISTGAPHQVNLKANTRVMYENQAELDEYNEMNFTTAKLQVIKLIEADTYRRFKLNMEKRIK